MHGGSGEAQNIFNVFEATPGLKSTVLELPEAPDWLRLRIWVLSALTDRRC